jgi:transposase-like protein
MASDISASRPISRRRYSAELKAEVLAQCGAPGASV